MRTKILFTAIAVLTVIYHIVRRNWYIKDFRVVAGNFN